MIPIERFNPNFDASQPGDRYVVMTESHAVTLEVRKVGPQTSGFHLSLVSAEPPLTEATFYQGEVIVRHDEVACGQTFELSALFPILTKTAFKALAIEPIESPTALSL